MAEFVTCPECQARLELPAQRREQSVQCPRCVRIFEPRMTSMPAAPRVTPMGAAPRVALLDDAPPAVSLSLTHVEPLAGTWTPTAAMIALAACLLGFLWPLHHHIERLSLRWPGAFPHVDPFRRQSDEGLALFLLTFLTAAVFFLIWLAVAARNAARLQVSDFTYGARTALCFFVPFANLVVPYWLLQEIWRASHPRAIGDTRAWKETPGSLAIRLWWACYLIVAALGAIDILLADGQFEHDTRAWIGCLSVSFIIAGTALMIGIIRGIQVRQIQRYERLYEAAE